MPILLYTKKFSHYHDTVDYLYQRVTSQNQYFQMMILHLNNVVLIAS